MYGLSFSIFARTITVGTIGNSIRWKLPIPIEDPSIGKCNKIHQKFPLRDCVHVKPYRWLTLKRGTRMLQVSMKNEKKVRWDGSQFHLYDFRHSALQNWIFVQLLLGLIGNSQRTFVMSRCDDEEPSSTGTQIFKYIGTTFGGHPSPVKKNPAPVFGKYNRIHSCSSFIM